MGLIYMDHHATTPVDSRVLAAMQPYFTQAFGNPASRTYSYGSIAHNAVESARLKIASFLKCKTNEIIFTSGATESDNLAIKGVATALAIHGDHIITLRTEHRAVLDACNAMKQSGLRITYLDVDADGRVDPESVRAAIEKKTILFSVMLANNEIGVLQDLATLAAIARAKGVIVHCDAAQGLGYLPFVPHELGIDLASISGHKIYGPKGIGALFVSRRLQSRGIPVGQIHGGGHEQGFRSGTLNVPGIVGLAEAATIMQQQGSAESNRIRALRDTLYHRLTAEIEDVRLNGTLEFRHPGNLNLSFGYVEGSRLLLELCKTVAVSSGAACSSAHPGPSHVLQALGVPEPWISVSVRFSLGRGTTQEQIDRVADTVIETVGRLRKNSPQWLLHQQGEELNW